MQMGVSYKVVYPEKFLKAQAKREKEIVGKMDEVLRIREKQAALRAQLASQAQVHRPEHHPDAHRHHERPEEEVLRLIDRAPRVGAPAQRLDGLRVLLQRRQGALAEPAIRRPLRQWLLC